MKIAKERIIYDNYNLRETYPDDYLRETALECGWVDEEITEEMLYDWRYFEDEANWDAEKSMLADFFKGKTVGFFGDIGLWDGVFKAGKIGEFWDLFDEAIEDCAYFRLYDENGHFYLTCSHHDGTNHFEIKEITDKGEGYLERWEYGSDNRSKQYVHNQIFKRYSKVPNYAHKVFGVTKREFKKAEKADLINKLNNQAKSFYS